MKKSLFHRATTRKKQSNTIRRSRSIVQTNPHFKETRFLVTLSLYEHSQETASFQFELYGKSFEFKQFTRISFFMQSFLALLMT